jgi:cyclase
MTEFITKYFQLEQLADGVFAAIINPGSGCIGNAAVMDLGGRTLVWDTFQNPRAALELRKFAALEFGNQPILVVNSHYHLDHCGGNQVFGDCEILATSKTREIIQTKIPGVIDNITSHPDYPREYAKQVEKETDPVRKQEMAVQLQDYEEINEMITTFQLTLPNVTFEESMVIHGQNRTARLFCYGGGHTPSDLMCAPQSHNLSG